MSIKLIVTHPGSSHKDDLLACCLLAHLHGVPIERREPADQDLADPEICVVDVGSSHDAALNNFDHHQFPKDGPPLCALSLVLQNLGLYEDALAFCEWLRPAEWLDTLGPVAAASKMGIGREAFGQLMSPVDITLLRRFADQTRLTAESPVYQVMLMIGEDLIYYLKGLRARLDYLREHCEFWTVSSEQGTVEAVFLERSEVSVDDPSFGLDQFVASVSQDREIVATVSPDRRGVGYGLTRYEDNLRVDFTRVKDCEDVRFVHRSGFVAKTDVTDQRRLKELLAQAIV